MDREGLLVVAVMVVVVVLFVVIGLSFDQLNCWLDGAVWSDGVCQR